MEGCSLPTTSAENSLDVFFYKSLTALYAMAWAALFTAHCDFFHLFLGLYAGSMGEQAHNIALEENVLSC